MQSRSCWFMYNIYEQGLVSGNDISLPSSRSLRFLSKNICLDQIFLQEASCKYSSKNPTYPLDLPELSLSSCVSLSVMHDLVSLRSSRSALSNCLDMLFIECAGLHSECYGAEQFGSSCNRTSGTRPDRRVYHRFIETR